MQTGIVDLIPVDPEQIERNYWTNVDQYLRESIGHLDSLVLNIKSVACLHIIVVQGHIVALQCNTAIPIELLFRVEDFRDYKP